MKSEEDEAFDELAKRQGAWGGGFKAKQAMAADKLQEDLLNYGTAWSQDGKRIDPMSVYKEPVTEREALKLALEALEAMQMYAAAERKGLRICDEAIASIKEALAQPAQEPVVDKGFPWTQKHVATPQVFGAMPSNIPPPQPAKEQHWNEDEWRRNNWRCGHGWLRGEQCEICNAAQEPPSEWAGIKAILDEYGLQAIDFVADFKAALAQPAQEPVREALKLALITLEGWDNHDKWVWPETALEQAKRNTKEAITAIKEALAQPLQKPYDQTALELCNVCGWKTLIPDDCCLNCERAQPAQEPSE